MTINKCVNKSNQFNQAEQMKVKTINTAAAAASFSVNGLKEANINTEK